MIDAVRLHAEAQQAEISGQMARSRSDMARAELRRRTTSCLKAKTRLLRVQQGAEPVSSKTPKARYPV